MLDFPVTSSVAKNNCDLDQGFLGDLLGTALEGNHISIPLKTNMHVDDTRVVLFGRIELFFLWLLKLNDKIKKYEFFLRK